MKKKKYIKAGFDIMGAGLSTTFGAEIATSAGATSTATAMGNISGKLPTMAKITGAGMVMGSLKELNTKKKYRRKK
jgi:hypothetical protein